MEEPLLISPPELENKPEPPPINIPTSTLQDDWCKMVNNEYVSDVQFHYKGDCYHGHKVALCAASQLFQQMFAQKKLNAGAVAAFRNIDEKYECY